LFHKATPKACFTLFRKAEALTKNLSFFNKNIQFILCGSSARKLKRGGADMLAGRAWNAELFPLTWAEMPDFDLERYLLYGGLPQVVTSRQPEEELSAYVQTYLQEEIRAEGLVRNLPPFSRFLRIAALASGEIINFTNIGNDSQVSPSTVREYYSLLEDTLIGFQLEAWSASKKRTETSAIISLLTRSNHIYSAETEMRSGRHLSFVRTLSLSFVKHYRRIRIPSEIRRMTGGLIQTATRLPQTLTATTRQTARTATLQRRIFPDTSAT